MRTEARFKLQTRFTLWMLARMPTALAVVGYLCRRFVGLARAAISQGMRWTGQADLPSIALTAHVLTQGWQHGLDCGLHDYLAKPIKLGVLDSDPRAMARSGC